MTRGTWIWVARVPWLPDWGLDANRLDPSALVEGYRALAETLAAQDARSVAVQIRLESTGMQRGKAGVIVPTVVGRAGSRESAAHLAALIRATLPMELPLHPVPAAEAGSAVRRFATDRLPLAAIAEIRRRVEDIDPIPGAALGADPATAAVLRWSPDAHGLRSAMAALAWHPDPVTVILHMEPASPSLDLMDHLDAIVREVAADNDPARNPIRRQVAIEYLRRLRDLPRAALEVRVMVVAADRLSPGLVEAVAMGLTEEQSFTVVRPVSDRDHLLATELVDIARARWWGSSGNALVDELQRLSDTAEAAGVVRLPDPAIGGTPGLPSVTMPTLPRSAQIDPPESGATVVLGRALGGGSVTLSLAELNQHLLVAGLPGFGKSTTMRALLAQLWQRHAVPFLVLDPAKSDYAGLIDGLASDDGNGQRVRRIRLSPERVGFNPLAIPLGSPTAGHAGRILAAFDAALGLSGTWPAGYITLGRALFAAYEDTPAGSAPTIRSLYASLGRTITQSGFQGPDGHNMRASLLGRIEFLVRGPLGATFLADSEGGVDWAELLSIPTVVELGDFAGPSERSLVFALLLAGLISYREAHPVEGRLGHVTVLEEAHRVLVGGSGQGSEGVRLFVEAIAELRGSGEGFAVVDQAPTLLHPGVLKLSGSILTHRLVEPTERLVIGSALLLDDRQQNDLARLGTGQAILYSAGRVGSVVVDVAPVHLAPDRSVPADGLPLHDRTPKPDLPFCLGCRRVCEHGREAPEIGRRLAAERDESEAALLDSLVEAGYASSFARCAAGAALAARTSDDMTLNGFLVALRELDDLRIRHDSGTRAGRPMNPSEGRTPGT